MVDKEDLSPPNTNKKDVGYQVVKAGLGAIPFAGSAAIELFSRIITPPLEKRREKWMRMIGEELEKIIEKQDHILEDIINDDSFIDVLLQASQAAMKTSQKQKLKALKNIVLNKVNDTSVDDSLISIFINNIDSFTDWHLQLLDFLNDPSNWGKRHNHTFPSYVLGNISKIIENAFPSLSGQKNFYNQIAKDLYNKGLLQIDELSINMSTVSLLQKKTTDIGDQFLKFIRDQ